MSSERNAGEDNTRNDGQTQASNDGKDSNNDNSVGSPNRFGVDIDTDLLKSDIGDETELKELLEAVDADTKADRLAEHYAEQAARQWGTPEGEWWP